MQMIAKRLHEGEDLKEAIEDMIGHNKISSATVISAVGSVSTVRLRMAGAKPEKQDIKTYNDGYEIVSLIGNIGQGRTHLHMAISDSKGNVFGGHLKEGSIVHTTVELVIAVDENLRFSEEIDSRTGFGELLIQKV